MRGRALLVVGVAIGYVVGTKQGREGWDRLVKRTRSLLGARPTQDALSKAGRLAEERIPVVGGAVSSAVGKVASAGNPASESTGSGSGSASNEDSAGAHAASPASSASSASSASDSPFTPPDDTP